MRGLLLVAGATLLCGPALAHPKLLSSSPAADATVPAARSIELRFSERLIAKLASIDLTMTDMAGGKVGAAMKVAGATTLGADGKSLRLVPGKPLAPGGYRLDYHVTSVDTHRVNGGFAFRVK